MHKRMKVQINCILNIFALSLIFSVVAVFASVEFKSESASPLILTPFIQSGEIEKAQALSRVKLYDEYFKSYSGFFTVNPEWDSNIFFWYIPAKVLTKSELRNYCTRSF